MWLGIGITIVIILLITILIAICEVWCKVSNLQIAIYWLMKEVEEIEEVEE